MHPFRLEIEQLSANHAAAAGRLHEFPYDLRRLKFREPQRQRRVPRLARRQRDHRQTRRRGHRDAIHSMHRGLSAPHVVVIHAREVVVHQRVGMNDFNRRREMMGIPIPTARAIRLQQQDRAQPLAFPHH